MAANNKCSDCGKDREPKYKNDSCCKRCRSDRNRVKRAEAMRAKGKQPYGSGRSTKCSACGNEKTASYLTSGYCGPCTSKRRKAKAVERRKLKDEERAKQGLAPYGSGILKPTCCSCGGPKEDPKRGYCYACKSRKERERYAKKRKEKGYVLRQRKVVTERFRDDPEFALKKRARDLVNRMLKAGHLVSKPCEVCGKTKVDAHHDDYSRALEVRWLCRLHHMQHHKQIESEK